MSSEVSIPEISGASEDELAIARVLVDCGQGHLFQNWPPTGERTADKRRFLQQAISLEGQVPGGLADYVSRAKKMLEASRGGVNPYEGYIPKVPTGACLETGSADGLSNFERLEAMGLEQMASSCFVMVAGGLGERLGYNGIKVALPSDTCTGVCFIDLYCQYLLAYQERVRSLKQDSSIVIPFAIMTSGDTDKKTRALLEENKNFGMADGQIIIIKQEKVPALNNNDAEFVLAKDDPFSLVTKPHGHGDVHTLIYSQGLSKKWVEDGKKWVVFFQDTNGLVFRALPATLGVSLEKKLAVNSLTVPRRPGEAVGAICRLESETKPSMTINVEYNQLDALMSASGVEDTVGESGFSSFPGNINVLVFDIQSYAAELEKSKGMISEFVNPKYKDIDKTIFKKPTRLECMMQDYPKCLGSDVVVGFTQCDRWTCFSAVKNNVIDAVAKFNKTGYGECAASGEADIYWAHRNVLNMAGVEIDVDGKEVDVGGIPIKRGANVILSPSFACVVADVKAKIQGKVMISNSSTLILEGTEIKIKNLQLDGALVVRVGSDARLSIDAVVDNAGWCVENVSQDDVTVDEKYRIRGYVMKKNEEYIVDLSKESGDYMLTNTSTGEPKIIELMKEEKVAYAIGDDAEVRRSNGMWALCKVADIDLEKKEYRVEYGEIYKLIPFAIASTHLRKIQTVKYSVDDVLELCRSNGTWVQCNVAEINLEEEAYKCVYGDRYKFVKFTNAASRLRQIPKPVSTKDSTEYKEDIHSFRVKSFTFDVDRKYHPIKVKGHGAYGVVISATDTDAKKKVAIKQIKEWSDDWVDGLRILREIKLLQHFAKYRHPNIVALDNLMASPVRNPFGEVYVVMDYMDTDMHKIIYSTNKFTNEHYQTWIHASLKGLRFLHSGNIIHRDIKPSNLLLNKDCHLKICDFGLARGIGQELNKQLTEYVVTRWYRAPELMCSCPYGPKVDIWALGCIFAELLIRKPLFQGKDYKDQLRLIVETLGTPDQEDINAIENNSARYYIKGMKTHPKRDYKDLFPQANEEGLDLLEKMLQFNPAKRINAEDALQHPWIKHLGTSDEDICPVALSFAFEDRRKLPQNDRKTLREAMWTMIREYHPELPVERQMKRIIQGSHLN